MAGANPTCSNMSVNEAGAEAVTVAGLATSSAGRYGFMQVSKGEV